MKQFTRLFIFLAIAAVSFSQTWVCYGEPVYPIYNGKEYQVKGTVVIDGDVKFYGDGSNITNLQWDNIAGTPTATPTPSLTPTPSPTPIYGIDGNVLTVAKDGTGDYTTIQGAVDSITDSSASNRYVIKIYPGVYAEQISLNENYVSLVGVSREQSRIVHTVSGEGYDKAIVRVSGSYGSIENLRIENTYNSGTDGKPAISIETQNVLIKDCDLITGGRDTVWIIDCAAADGNVILDRCYVEGDYDVLSAFRSFKVQNSYIKVNGSSQVIYADTQATAKDITIYSLYNTIYQVGQKYVEEVGTGTNSINVYSAFINTNQAFAATTSPYVTYHDYLVEPSMTIGTSFDVLGTAEISGTLTALSDIKAVDVKTTNFYAPQTNSYFSIYTGAVEGAGVYFSKTGGGDIMRWSPTTGKLEFDPGALEDFDTNLYRGDANQLKTDDNFNCLALLTNGTTRISSAGVVTSTQTNTDNIRLDGNTISITDTNGSLTLTPNGNGNAEISKTKWKDWAATAVFQPADSATVENWIVGSGGGDPCWAPISKSDVTALYDTMNGDRLIMPIPYESGTILTRLRVKWQAVGDNDGVTVTLLKRDESGSTSSFTTIGSAQTYTDPGTPYPVTVSTYDFADETMADNCSYSIAVDSVVAASGVYLYAVGVETSKRVY